LVEVAECGLSVPIFQLPGRSSVSAMNGSFQSAGVRKSPPSALSLGLSTTGKKVWP
jgi:hypothetical protein